jgi:hypothetical protein
VVNRLTSPEATSSARILVFASAGDDIEFAGPKELDVWSVSNVVSLSNLTTAIVQTDFDQAVEPTNLTSDTFEPDVYHEVFGERVSSFREYLHRSSLAFTYVFNETVGTGASSVRLNVPFKRLPPAPGIYNNGWNITTTASGAGQRTFLTRMHPITSIGSCFIGYKGSVNVTTNFNAPNGITWLDTLSLTRQQDARSISSASRRPTVVEIPDNLTTSSNNRASNTLLTTGCYSGVTGRALTNPRTNTGLAANIPYYGQSGFRLFNMYNEYNNQATLTDNNVDWWCWVAKYQKPAGVTTTGQATLDAYYATGPDFDLVFFINVPLLNTVLSTSV